MPYTNTPYTRIVADAVRAHWDLDHPLDEASAQRLHGGEESAAYRLGDVVVRIGPRWRVTADAEWSHSVAAAAGHSVPEAIAPVPCIDGATVVRVDDRPVSVWPYVQGTWGDDQDEHQAAQAADLLARLHLALAAVTVPPRPHPLARRPPALEDKSLDVWRARFAILHAAAQPVHGDFYAGNVLVRDGRIVALVDWDEAFVGPPEYELAWAACEWGDVLARGELSRAMRFVEHYAAAGGTAAALDEGAVRQLYRHRLQLELAYAAEMTARGVALDADDHDYHARQVEVFWHLK